MRIELGYYVFRFDKWFFDRQIIKMKHGKMENINVRNVSYEKACVRLFMGKQGRNNRKRVMRDKDWNLTKPMHAKTEWIWMRTYHAYLTYDFIQSFLRILNIFPHTVDPRSFLNNPGCLVFLRNWGTPLPNFPGSNNRSVPYTAYGKDSKSKYSIMIMMLGR